MLKVRDHVFTFCVRFVTPNGESRTYEASAKYLLILRVCGLLILLRADLLHPFLWTLTVVLTQIRILKLNVILELITLPKMCMMHCNVGNTSYDSYKWA